MKSHSFIIIGCGAIGKRHAAIIHNRYQLNAVCDIDAEKANALAKIYGCKSYTNFHTMLIHENLTDVAVICTPNGLHAQHSIDALNAGLHVLCEKPLAINVLDCDRMIEASEINKKHLLVVKQNRFNPPVQAVNKLLADGGLGKIIGFQVNGFWSRGAEYYAHKWKGSKLLDGGILYTQFSHFIDILYWFLGEIEVVEAMADNLIHQNQIEIEDSVCALVKSKNGALGTIHFNINTFKKNAEGSITLFGEKGTVKIGGEYLNAIAYWQVDGIEMPILENGNPANDYGTYVGTMSNHPLVYDHLDAVLNNQVSPNPLAKDAMKSIEIIASIYKKLHT